jgi:DNA-binding CsgD family transcriptional regulator
MEMESMHNNIINFDSLQYTPGAAWVKDVNSCYLAASVKSATIWGFVDIEQVVGIRDYNLRCKASEAAEQFIAQDRHVLSTRQSMVTLNVCCYFGDNCKVLLGQKSPIINEDGDVSGVFFQGIDVTELSVLKYFMQLNKRGLGAENVKSTSYILSAEHCPIKDLSIRQQECLFWLVRGKTFEEIAKLLALSPRTIESYINSIKYKFGCYTKGQIIEKAIDSGFLFYIPRRFLPV